MGSLIHPKMNFKNFIFISSANTRPLGVNGLSWFQYLEYSYINEQICIYQKLKLRFSVLKK